MKGSHRVGRAASVALLLVLAAACGGNSGSPAAPSTPGSPAASSPTPGATINGTVAGATSASAVGAAPLGASTGVTITVAGTGLSVTTDSQGRFVLTGVPAGTVQLVITANGTSTTLTLNGVQATDQITIKITVHGTTASLDSEERNGSGMTEIEDRITAINPGGTTRTVDVGTTRVSIPEVATVRHGNDTIAFADLHVGDRVHVRGAMTGSVLVATEVMVQNTNANVPVNASGTVSLLQGSCPAIRFTVENWVVETNTATSFQKGDCSGIANGTSVHVKGDVQATGRVLATWVQLGK